MGHLHCPHQLLLIHLGLYPMHLTMSQLIGVFLCHCLVHWLNLLDWLLLGWKGFLLLLLCQLLLGLVLL